MRMNWISFGRRASGVLAAAVTALMGASTEAQVQVHIPPTPTITRPQVPDFKVGFNNSNPSTPAPAAPGGEAKPEGKASTGGGEAAEGAPPVPPPGTAPVEEVEPTGETGASDPPAGLPGGLSPGGEGGGGLIQRMARNLFGAKEGDAAASKEEEDALGPESREGQRRTKELVNLALRNIERARISEAKKNLNDLITLKPYDADYHLALGLCFRKEKRYKDALKKYQDVLDLGGPRSLVTLLMAEVAAESGEKDKVFELLKEAAVSGRNIVNDVQTLPLLEKYKGDTEFIKLALHLEKFEVKAKRGQDPFTNPFPSAVTGKISVGPVPTTHISTQLSPEEQQKLLNESRRLYEKIQWYIKLEDEDKAMENYQRLREIMDKREGFTVPKIVNDFRILASRMENLETQIEGIRLKYYWNQAQGRLKEIKEAFLATEYGRVDSLYADIEKLAKEMERANARFKPVADRILAAGRVWINRANIRREFQASKPDIQGVVISPEAKLAIIDNRILKQGESFGDFQIQKVENNRVTFRYKGEEIPLIFRRY